MPDDAAILSLELPGRAEAPAAARKALTALNGALHLVSHARLQDVQLLVTELVANAVRHGAGGEEPVHLSVLATPESLRVEVSDHGRGFDPDTLDTPSTERAGGWGLEIVRTLAPRWGVAREDGTCVWFEIDRPTAEVPVQPSPPGEGTPPA